MKLEGITLKEKRDYASILFVKADTKRLKAIGYDNKKNVLLNKEREVRKTNAGGMAKKKYRRFHEHKIKRTGAWHLEQLEKIKEKRFDYLKLEVKDEKQKETIFNFLKKQISGRKWFEKFRSEELDKGIIVGGKDRKSNEELLKNHLGKEDLVFHTEMKGSPFFILKRSKEKEDIFRAAFLTAGYSQDWKKNRRDVEVMYVYGKQIHKRKQMPLGTFGTNGKRHTILIKRGELLGFKI
jgi:predicted ribosome quality control (RQC) complex YloA/Tae2 family protein